MHNGSNQTNRCQSPQNNLMNTPEHLRPGFSGQSRQNDSREFGPTGHEEEWQQQNTNRQVQPRRTEFCPPLAHNLSNLPEEYLGDMSPPTFDLSMQTETEVEAETDRMPLDGNQPNTYVDSLYQAIVNQFDELRERISRRANKLQETSHALCNPNEVSTSQNNDGTETTFRKVTTRRDQCGNVTSRLEETSTRSNGRLGNQPDCADENSVRQVNFSENLADESMPLFYDESMPAMSTRISPQGPPILDTTERRMQTPVRTVGNIQVPSFGTNVCLDDISAPSLAPSTITRSRYPAIRDICEIPAPSRGAQNNEGPMDNSRECLENVTMHSFGGVSGVSNRHMPSECLEDVSAPSLSFERSRSANRRQDRTQHISDITAPSFESSDRGTTSANSCLEDMSMPSFGGVSGASRARNLSQQQRSMPSQKIYDISSPSFGNNDCDCFENTGVGTATNQRLEDISMPSFGEVSGAFRTRSQRRQPTQNICDTSAPSFQSTGRNQCLEDISMPSFGGVSSASRSMSQRRREPLTNECLENITMPSFGGVSGSSRRKQSMPSERLENIIQPSFDECSSSFGGRQQNMPSECLENIPQPTFTKSMSRGHQNMSTARKNMFNSSTYYASPGNMPSECLADMSAPSFGRSMSRGRSARSQQRSMPSQNIWDITAPSFGSSGRGQTTDNQCLEDMSMPSFGGVSGASRARTRRRHPTHNIYNTSTPSFQSTGRGQMTNECLENIGVGTATNQRLEDISMPSFGEVSSASRSRSQRRHPTQNICDTSAPSYQSTGRGQNSEIGTATNQRLEDISMPSFGGVSSASRSRSQRRHPTQNICDTSVPSYQSTGRGLTTNECLENIIQDYSGRQPTMPSECLEDITQPSFGRSIPSQNMYDRECLKNVTMPSYVGVSGVSTQSYKNRTPRGRSAGHQQRSMPSQNICDITAPSLQSSSRGYTTNSCLENISMPSFGEVSEDPRSRSQRRQPNQNIFDTSAPSFQSTGRGQMTNERFENIGIGTASNQCLEDISVPSFGGVSGATRSRSQRRHPTHNISDTSAPSFQSTGRGQNFEIGTASNQRMEDISVPSFGGVSGATRSRSQRRHPTQNICDTSVPSYQGTGRDQMTNECLENMTMPSFGGVSGSSRRQQTMPSECLDNITQHSFERSFPPDSFRNIYNTNAYYHNECLENVTMPSFGEVSAAANRQMNSMPSECLEDISAPSFERSMSRGRSLRRPQRPQAAPSFGASSRQQRAMPSQNICDISAPSFENTGQGQMTSDCLEDMSMPSFGGISGVSRAKNLTRQQRSMPSQNICDISAPSFPNSERRIMTNECLDNITMPSFPERSLSQGASPRRQPRSQNINDISVPSYYNSTQGQVSNECLDNMTMPSFDDISGVERNQTMNRECFNGDFDVEQLWDISAPDLDTYNSNPRRPHSEPTYPSECLDDVTEPGNDFSIASGSPQITRAYLNDSSMPFPRRVHSFPCIPSQQAIGDISAPTMSENSRGVETSYPNEMLGNVSAPSYVNNTSRQDNNHPVVLTWAPNISGMPSENLDTITEPTMFNNNSTQGYTNSSNRSPNNFARSTAVGEMNGTAASKMDAHFGTGQNNSEPKDATSKPPGNLADSSNVGHDSNKPQESDIDKSTTQTSTKSSNPAASEKLPNDNTVNDTSQGPSANVTKVKEVNSKSLKSSSTHKNRSRDRDYHNTDKYEKLNNISMPAFESTNNNRYIPDISVPTCSPITQTTYDHCFSNLCCDSVNNCETYRGCCTRDNCAPTKECSSRVSNRHKPKSSSNTLRSDNPTVTRGKCNCNNNCTCQKNRKKRQNQ